MFSFLAPFKMYFYAAALAAILGGISWFNGVLDERTELRAEKVVNLQIIANQQKEKKDITEQAIKDRNTLIEFQNNLRSQIDEINKSNASVTNGTSRLRPNANCTELPKPVTDTGRAEPAVPRFNPDAEQAWFDIQRAEVSNKALYERAMKRVIEDYEKCGTKPDSKK